MKSSLSPLLRQSADSAVLTPSAAQLPDQELWTVIERLNLPAALYVSGHLYPNRRLEQLVSTDELALLSRSDRISQIARQMAIVNDTMSFDLSLGERTYHCMASTCTDNSRSLLLTFEDISAEANSEKNNALLYRLTLLFSSGRRPLTETLQMALDQILFELALFDGSIMLFDTTSGTLAPVAWGTTNLNSSINGTSVFKLGQGIGGRVAQTLRPIVIPDVMNDPRFIRKFTDTGHLTLLCLPLSIGSQIFGVMSLTRNHTQVFSDREVQFFSTIANRLSLLIEADQIDKREQKEAELHQLISSSLNIYDQIDDMVRLVSELLKVDRCLIFEHQSNSLQALPRPIGSVGSTRINRNQLVALRRHLTPQFYKKTGHRLKKPLFSFRKTNTDETSPGILIPLVARGRHVGCLFAQNTTWNRSFTDTELEIAHSIASQLAVAMEISQFHEEVLEERNQMQQVLDSMRDGVVLYTPDMRVALYNQATRRLLGIRKDFTGQNWEEALNTGAMKYSEHTLIRHFDAYKFFNDAIKQGKTSTGLATVTTKPPRTLEIATGPVYDRQGNISGVLSHSRDITQMHELQLKMAARVQQLTGLFKISSVSGFNVQQIVRRILRLVLPLLSIKASQLILIDQQTKQPYALESVGETELLKKISPKLARKIKWVIKQAEPRAYTIRAKSDEQNIHALITPILGHHDTCIGVLLTLDQQPHRSFSRDDINLLGIVAARIASKLDNAWLLNQVEEDRNKLAAIIEQSVDGILVLDNENRIQIWNTALENLSGLLSDEVMGQDVISIRNKIEVLEQTEDGNLTEMKIRNSKTGNMVWLGIAYSPITQDRGGEIIGYIAIVRDITRQKELEKTKNEFVSTASHELRSPITAIVGYLSMLKRGDAGQIVNRQQAFFVDKAYQNAKRMVGLIEDLLMTTRMETGQLRYQVEPINILPIVENVISDLRFRAEEKEIEIKLQRTAQTLALTDRDGIHQVLNNIINNAIKYTPNKGKVAISFRSVTEDKLPYLIISINDSGVGIDPVDQAKIFEKFSRVDNPLSVSAGGTGLGLYITQSIIEELGGTIWVESERDKGSTFYIRLPRPEKSR